MKTNAAIAVQSPRAMRLTPAALKHQRGMGATIVLFTIALIVLVGAALAYASRGNPSAQNTQGARVFAGVLLKQSADYRDGYSRFIFDGRDPATMTFNTALGATTDLFNPTLQLSTYQPPPSQATTVVSPTLPAWLYNVNAAVDGVGTTAPESITYVPAVTEVVCAQVNFQMYGSLVIPTSTLANSAAVGTSGATITTASPATPGRASGCIKLADNTHLFYSTLGEG